MKGYLNPYNGGGDGNDDEITDSFNGGGMGNYFDRNQSSALGGQPSQSSLAPL
jgi:hypothetical protein